MQLNQSDQTRPDLYLTGTSTIPVGEVQYLSKKQNCHKILTWNSVEHLVGTTETIDKMPVIRSDFNHHTVTKTHDFSFQVKPLDLAPKSSTN